MAAPHVVAVFHEAESAAEQVGYKLWHLAAAWRARGISFEVSLGVPASPRAEVWINHLDLTRVPPRYAEFFAAQPVVVNRVAVDISKRRISRNLLMPEDAWSGPVIVKTDLNHGGVPERRAFGRRGHGDDPRPPRSRIARWHPGAPALLQEYRRRSCVDPAGYAVYEALAQVPDAIWKEDAFVVERFLPERDGSLYCGRCYLFLGDRSISLRKWGTAPVLRARNVTRMEPIPDCPQMVEERRRLGFDYGKFDYVVHEGRSILLDATRTPTFAFAGAALNAVDRAMVERLSGGLDAYLAG